MAGIGSPRQCRSGIDEADQPCHTGPAPVPRCARVGLDTGMNLAVRTGVGPVSSAVSCSRSSTASRFPRHPPGEPHIPGASALALRAPSDAPESEPHETSQSRRAEQQSRRTAVRRRHPMSDFDRHSHPRYFRSVESAWACGTAALIVEQIHDGLQIPQQFLP